MVRYGYRYSKRYSPFLRKTAYSALGRVARYAARSGMSSLRRSRFGRPSMKKRFKRENNFSKIGITPNQGTGKKTIQRAGIQSLATRTLYAEPLVNISHTASNVVNGRQRNIVNISGFKICWELRNESNAGLWFNYAIIAPRNDLGGPTTPDFFRSNGTERGEDFSVSLDSNRFHCANINTDKYIVLKHKRSMFIPTANTGTDIAHSGKNFRHYQMYIKMKRQIRFDSTATAIPTTRQPYLVYWMDKVLTPGGTAATTVATENLHITTYWREPLGH